MKTAARPLTTVVAAAAVAAMAGLIVTMGSAGAATAHAATAHDYGYDPHVHHDDTHNNTRTTVHNSGSGPVAVNVAGPHGNAGQHLDQHLTDRSRVNVYEDRSRTRVRHVENSHNSGRYRY